VSQHLINFKPLTTFAIIKIQGLGAVHDRHPGTPAAGLCGKHCGIALWKAAATYK
jgi:hypothetical protein